MLNDEIINQRLEGMKHSDDPSGLLWPENCEGSRRALVIFVGPSPGGKKKGKRRKIKLSKNDPLWDKPYEDPLEWSRGFRVSFKPIVEKIFERPYAEAAKLIARFNMDWLQNPESKDVSYRYMWEGCSHILPVIYECMPDLIVPMDEKTFGVMQMALYNDGYEIFPARVGEISIEILDKKEKSRQHRKIMGYKAEKEGSSFLVIKSPQHPARIYDDDYASRVGQAIRLAAVQMWNDEIVKISL